MAELRMVSEAPNWLEFRTLRKLEGGIRRWGFRRSLTRCSRSARVDWGERATSLVRQRQLSSLVQNIRHQCCKYYRITQR